MRFEVRARPRIRHDSVAEWAAALNAALRRGLADHAARPEWDAARTTRGGEALAAFQNRCAVAGRSVVSNAYSSGGAWPNAAVQAESNAKAARAEQDPLLWEGVLSDPRDSSVAERLRASGMALRLHTKPSGDSPAVLSPTTRGRDHPADTSYSDPAAGPTADGDAPRGCAVARHAVRRVGRGQPRGNLGRAEGRAAPCGGPAHAQAGIVDLAIATSSGPNHEGDPHVGLELDGEWCVKARLVDAPGGAPTVLGCRGKGRGVEDRDQTV